MHTIRLKAQGNMSDAVDRLIQLVIEGKVEHDGCLNPIGGSNVDFRKPKL